MTVRVAVPLALAAIAAALAYFPRPGPETASASGASPSTEPSCAADVTSFVGLSVGSTLHGWKVVHLGCTEPRRVDVELTRGASRTVLTVAAEGAIPHEPPRRVGKVALFYSHRESPPDRVETDALLQTLADGLAAKPPSSW